MPGDSEHPVTLGDLRVLLPLRVKGRIPAAIRPATVADLVSALRAEGVLVVERGTGSWPDTARWPEWAVDAYEQAQAGYADRVWVLEYLDALAEAQPFPPAGG